MANRRLIEGIEDNPLVRQRAEVIAASERIKSAVRDAAGADGSAGPEEVHAMMISAASEGGGGGGGPARLTRAAAAKKKGGGRAGIHEVHRLLAETAFYPPHDARRETAAYKKVHDKLVAKGACLICGVTNAVLKDPKRRSDPALNPFGARQLETHHHVLEWAFANAVDVDKFNQFLLPHLAARHPDNPDYRRPFTQEQVQAWVDHSPDNLWVLCDVHHRHKQVGIHEISDPIWGPQNLFRAEIVVEIMKALQESGRKKSTREVPAKKAARGNATAKRPRGPATRPAR